MYCCSLLARSAAGGFSLCFFKTFFPFDDAEIGNTYYSYPAYGVGGLDVFGKSAAEYGYKGKAKSGRVAILPFVFGYIELCALLKRFHRRLHLC